MNARAQDGPIESYLDALLSACAGLPPREVRRLLAESEAHLYDEVESLLCTGVRDSEAQERAVARFGPARAIAHAERDRSRVPLLAIARQIIGSAVLVGSIGAVAVGISGLLAAIFRAVRGARFVAGDPSSGALTGAAHFRLPDGGMLSVATSDVHMPDGERLEGVGYKPEITVPWPVAGRRAGIDPQLQRALATLSS